MTGTASGAGDFDLESLVVDGWRRELHRDFEIALSETKLPERPDYEAANRFLIECARGNGSQTGLA